MLPYKEQNTALTGEQSATSTKAESSDRPGSGSIETSRLTRASTPEGEQEEEISPQTIHEFHPECEVSFEGGRDLKKLFQNCQKNPGHTNFVSMQAFLNLGKKRGDLNTFSDLQSIANRTVKMTSFLVSDERPNVYAGTSIPYPYSHLKGENALRCGTGYVNYVNISQSSVCLCLDCRKSTEPKEEHYEIKIVTSCHVIYNTEEAKDTVMELFYDSEDDKTGVRKLRGISAEWSNSDLDVCYITCVTHDKELANRLGIADNGISLIRKSSYSREQIGWIISHPHGRSKYITKGTLHLGSRTLSGSAILPFITSYRLPRRSLLSRIFKRNGNPGKSRRADRPWHNPRFEYYDLPWRSRWIFPQGCYQGVWHRVSERGWTYLYHDDNCHAEVPSGTLIELPGGEQVPCPDGAEIDVRRLYDHFTYDISTCPGSSGAPILCWDDDNHIRVCWSVCHAGAEKDYNRSSFENLIFW